jgi:hypothetical protein
MPIIYFDSGVTILLGMAGVVLAVKYQYCEVLLTTALPFLVAESNNTTMKTARIIGYLFIVKDN